MTRPTGVFKRLPEVPSGFFRWFDATPKAVLAELIYDLLGEVYGLTERDDAVASDMVRWLQDRQQVLADAGLSSEPRRIKTQVQCPQEPKKE